MRFRMGSGVWIARRRRTVAPGATIPAATIAAGLALACGDGPGVGPPTPPEPPGFEPGPLGAVTLSAGEAVSIRSMLSMTVWPSGGVPSRHGVELAVRDVGTVRGRMIDLGDALDSACGPEGGRAVAQQVVADPKVAGVVGTTCSAAAVAASPVISQAGYVMIAPSTTSPLLTSDLAGNPNPDYHAGYFRVSNNDLYQARALSDFAFNELGLRRVATVHDGDPYTSALVAAFEAAFEALGGEVPAATSIAKGDTDMTPALTELAATAPGGIFFPLFEAEGTPFAAQAQGFDGLEGATLISGSALLVSTFLATPQSEGMYFAGPESDFGSNVNGVTEMSGAAVLAAYEAAYGGPPPTPYWAHAYDATTLLLHAIETVAVEEDGRLHIDRAGLRAEIGRTSLTGLIGGISCDDFGDCGTGRINIVHHADSRVTDVAQLPVVYRFAP